MLYPYHLNNYSPFSFLCPKSANSCASWLLYTALQLLINRTDCRVMRNFPRNLVPVHCCPTHYLLNLARIPTGLSKASFTESKPYKSLPLWFFQQSELSVGFPRLFPINIASHLVYAQSKDYDPSMATISHPKADLLKELHQEFRPYKHSSFPASLRLIPTEQPKAGNKLSSAT